MYQGRECVVKDILRNENHSQPMMVVKYAVFIFNNEKIHKIKLNRENADFYCYLSHISAKRRGGGCLITKSLSVNDSSFKQVAV